jgi:hypothetical protein
MAYNFSATIDNQTYDIKASDTAALAFVRKIYGEDFKELSETELIDKIISLDTDYNLLDGLDRIVSKYFDITLNGSPAKLPILGKLDLATGIIPLIRSVTEAFPSDGEVDETGEEPEVDETDEPDESDEE